MNYFGTVPVTPLAGISNPRSGTNDWGSPTNPSGVKQCSLLNLELLTAQMSHHSLLLRKSQASLHMFVLNIEVDT